MFLIPIFFQQERLSSLSSSYTEILELPLQADFLEKDPMVTLQRIAIVVDRLCGL